MGRIWDILECSRKVREFLGGLTYQEFLEDERTQDAVIRNVQNIGEASSKISDDLKQRVPSVDWRRAVNMRHVLVHDYDKVRLDVVWEAAKHDLPQLEEALRPWLNDES
ncbi:DUF86 domain-containing protein [bacterium]|nr:DUF86 domain-containing protein [bacterium]